MKQNIYHYLFNHKKQYNDTMNNTTTTNTIQYKVTKGIFYELQLDMFMRYSVIWKCATVIKNYIFTHVAFFVSGTTDRS